MICKETKNNGIRDIQLATKRIITVPKAIYYQDVEGKIRRVDLVSKHLQQSLEETSPIMVIGIFRIYEHFDFFKLVKREN